MSPEGVILDNMELQWHCIFMNTWETKEQIWKRFTALATIATVQTLAQNEVKSTRQQRLYPGYFGFTFV